MRVSIIEGVGAYLPEKVLSNDDLSQMVDTSDEWIRMRTGIRQRHIAADNEWTSDLGVEACKKAMQAANIGPEDIDLVILATATPDRTFPATATTIQAKLGITNGAAFDVGAVCSGFLFALTTADHYLARGQFNTALVVGAETFSRILDWEDRSTCVLFGDGAGSVVLRAYEPETANGRGCIASQICSNGAYCDLLYVDGGPSSTQTVGHLRMQGNQVFKHAVRNISDAIMATLNKSEFTIKDVDWFVPHQANSRILDGVARQLGLEHERIISTIEYHGNTSAASVPLALDTAVKDGRIKKGDLVLAEAMGGGFSWGACLFRM